MVMNFRRAVKACAAPLRKMEPAEDFEIDLITPRGPVVMGYQRASIETADKTERHKAIPMIPERCGSKHWVVEYARR